MSNLENIALQARADEAADQRAAANRVADYVESATPSEPVETRSREEIEADERAKQLDAAAAASLPILAKVIVGIADRGVQSMVGAHAAATEEERETLATTAVPVIEKYLGGVLGGFIKTPEGVLLATAVMIYAPKIAFGPPAHPPAAAAANAVPEATA